MTNYYYTENPDVQHDEKTWNFTLLEHDLNFTTDNGVFSKSRVDFGSCVMLDTLAENEAELLAQAKILDVGCGYGPIGLALAKKWPANHVDMVDVNNLAMDLARKNAHNNGISNVSIFPSNQYEGVTTTNYDFVLTNPPIRAGKPVVHGILSGAYDHLKVGGRLVVVIQKKQGAPSAQKKMTEVFGNCQVLKKNKGYFILEAVKEV